MASHRWSSWRRSAVSKGGRGKRGKGEGGPAGVLRCLLACLILIPGDCLHTSHPTSHHCTNLLGQMNRCTALPGWCVFVRVAPHPLPMPMPMPMPGANLEPSTLTSMPCYVPASRRPVWFTSQGGCRKNVSVRTPGVGPPAGSDGYTWS